MISVTRLDILYIVVVVVVVVVVVIVVVARYHLIQKLSKR